MGYTQTRVIAIEYVCDSCGLKEAVTRIEGVSDEATAAITDAPWRFVDMEVRSHQKKRNYLVCSLACWLVMAEKGWGQQQ